MTYSSLKDAALLKITAAAKRTTPIITGTISFLRPLSSASTDLLTLSDDVVSGIISTPGSMSFAVLLMSSIM